ncbi:MAG: TetR/AcrR family transcriptional regulator [Ilumatobacteraceae bacterium]
MIRALPPPTTARGARTRQKVKTAARELFECNGFQDTSVNQIVARADVAHGTFYTYFDSKEQVFAEIVGELFDEFATTTDALPVTGAALSERIERTNRGYLLAYARNGRLMAAVEQAATLSPALAEIRRTVRVRWIERNTAAIARWQARGAVSATIDARFAAEILGSMVNRTAYVTVVLEERGDLDDLAVHLTRLYCNALGIPYHRDVP